MSKDTTGNASSGRLRGDPGATQGMSMVEAVIGAYFMFRRANLADYGRMPYQDGDELYEMAKLWVALLPPDARPRDVVKAAESVVRRKTETPSAGEFIQYVRAETDSRSTYVCLEGPDGHSIKRVPIEDAKVLPEPDQKPVSAEKAAALRDRLNMLTEGKRLDQG